jgi:hypothetical protein
MVNNFNNIDRVLAVKGYWVEEERYYILCFFNIHFLCLFFSFAFSSVLSELYLVREIYVIIVGPILFSFSFLTFGILDLPVAGTEHTNMRKLDFACARIISRSS